MTQKPETKSKALSLEVEAIETYCNPGCGSSSTDPRCTCPIRLTTTASERVQTHQPEMRLLVQRLRSDQQADRVRRVEIGTSLEQRRHLLEDRQELELELISPSDQPLLVAVVWQQTIAI